MGKKWLKGDDDFMYQYPREAFEILPPHIYLLKESIFGFYLERVGRKFEFSHKIYGLESKLIERVAKSYKNTDKNLGVLLNGVKGTGKTVTSKIICNTLKQPVIIINKKFGDNNPNEFLCSIEQDFTIFIDEYEKIYAESHELLTIMDGVMNSKNKRLFILTTNDLYINSNMLERPSRIRYLKTFKDLQPDIVAEIVDDLLEDNKFYLGVINFVSTLQNITVDIVKAVIEEVNLFKEDPSEFKDIFNVQKITGKYDIFVMNTETKKSMSYINKAKIYPNKLSEHHVGYDFQVNDVKIGQIVEYVGRNTVRIKFDWRTKTDLKNLTTSVADIIKDKETKDLVVDAIVRRESVIFYAEPADIEHFNYKYSQSDPFL